MALDDLIIDPGHGGTDPGAVGNGIIEKVYTLEVSLYQFARFKALGVPVKMTRTVDKYLGPNERSAIVKNSGAKQCISNHVNAGGGDGAEVIHSIYSDGKLAREIADNLARAGQNVRRIFSRKGSSGSDYYYMHRQTGSVSTNIVEYGFLDSKGDDVRQLKTDQIRYAEAVVKAYCQHFGFKYTTTDQKEAIKDSAEVLPDGVYRETDDYKAEVKTIQIYLNYFLGANKLDADGYYGQNTVAAVKSFQKARGITVDGVYGPDTKRELQEFYAEKMAREQKKKPEINAVYKVQVGAFGSHDNAMALAEKLKDKGFPAFVYKEEK
jgi:hypothetical protein